MVEASLARSGPTCRAPQNGSTIFLRIQATIEGNTMKVTHAQKMEFYKKGYVRVPGVVPSVMVDAAVKAINHSLSITACNTSTIWPSCAKP